MLLTLHRPQCLHFKNRACETHFFGGLQSIREVPCLFWGHRAGLDETALSSGGKEVKEPSLDSCFYKRRQSAKAQGKLIIMQQIGPQSPEARLQVEIQDAGTSSHGQICVQAHLKPGVTTLSTSVCQDRRGAPQKQAVMFEGPEASPPCRETVATPGADAARGSPSADQRLGRSSCPLRSLLRVPPEPDSPPAQVQGGMGGMQMLPVNLDRPSPRGEGEKTRSSLNISNNHLGLAFSTQHWPQEGICPRWVWGWGRPRSPNMGTRLQSTVFMWPLEAPGGTVAQAAGTCQMFAKTTLMETKVFPLRERVSTGSQSLRSF